MLAPVQPECAQGAPGFWREWLEEAATARVLRRIAVRDAAWRRDRDGDGVPDVADNCPECWNPSQRDFDLDGVGDCCDWDDDNDGEYDTLDPNPHNAEVWSGIPRCAVGLYGPTGSPTTFHHVCAGRLIDFSA